MNPSFYLKFIVVFIFVVGAFTFFGSIYQLFKAVIFYRHSTPTKAEVVAYDSKVFTEPSKNSQGSYGKYRAYFATVAFQANGERIVVRLSEGRNTPFQEGEQLNIRYDNRDPKIAKLDSFKNNWLPCIIVLFVGAIFIIVAKIIWGVIK